ncbi:MAG: GH92 family glycosyl hydrolase [Saprospiraceae bacterium]|nr:GH92 family glycosyl hydrolase [Saprospiraceae bacterium]
MILFFRRYFFLVLLLISCNRNEEINHDQSASEDPVDLVDPLVDAANSRWFFFNSATRPFGMVNLSPDMVINGAWNSGYRYHVDSIRAFSHIHAWQLSGIPVFPTVGHFKGHLGADVYASTYSHERETVRPGYHQIFLDTYGIDVELTSTDRVGFHRYTFPAADSAFIQIDLSTFLGPCDTDSGLIRRVNNQSLEGYAVMGATRRRPYPVTVFFAIQFDQPFDSFGGWKDGHIMGRGDEISGARIGGFIQFKTYTGDQRLMKVGISYTSIESARNNIEQELSGWDFDEVRTASRQTWNEWLGKIKIKGGDLIQRQRFYTDLWHALQGRRMINDYNGSYPDMTSGNLRIGQIPLGENGRPKFNHYNSDSFWGAQWTINTLWQLVYPRVAEEFVQSMLLMYQDGGLVPRGPSGGNYTYVMTGASSTPFVVAAYEKGLKNFDVEMAYMALRKNHMPGGMMSKAGYEHNTNIGGGLEYYIDRGYIPYPLPNGGKGYHESGSGQTLEYAFQDGCLAQMAKSLGHIEDYKYFTERSKNYRNIWYPKKGWMWIKNEAGQWKEPFDELLYGKGFVESNAAQMSWFVPHDVAGLISLMGGDSAFVDKLNKSFTEAAKQDFTSGKAHSSETHEDYRRTYINYGNQPSMQTAFLFNYAKAPWLSQYWSRQVVQKVYSDLSPEYGYSGDEDQGLMGSLAVLMKMGIFSMNGGACERPFYEIGSPIFDEIKIDLDANFYPGKEFIISVENQAEENYYIQKATLNRMPWERCWIYHDDLVKGGVLELKMGSSPNRNWGITEVPPTY